MDRSNRLVAIIGPTAGGKTGLALGLARRFDGEIVNADSRQIYRGMDIGTAKPTPEERREIPHHLFDIVAPDEPFSLVQYLELVTQALREIWDRGRLPFLVGGTGQYVWAVVEGWQVPSVPPQPALRAELERRAEQEGSPALYRELQALDPAAAARIHPNNTRRIVRALEVVAVTGRPFSAQQQKGPPPFASLVLGLDVLRAVLYCRIDARVEEMVRAGLVDEVRQLLSAGYGPDLPSMSGIGYREIAAYLLGRPTLDEAKEQIKTATHRLARMQGAWFRRGDPRIHWLPDGPEAAFQASALIQAFLSRDAPTFLL